jgi:transcriptional regulator with XRE-family HTH domain
MPPRAFTPSSYVGRQVRHFRAIRGMSQQRLADRLAELGVPGWSQTKITKIEQDKQQVLVDDLFALALALDVSPLYLLTPRPGYDEEDNALMVAIDGGKVARWPRDVRQWIRGVRPLLNRGDYRDDDAAAEGRRFYLLGSQPLSEWHLIAESEKQARRISEVHAVLEEGD